MKKLPPVRTSTSFLQAFGKFWGVALIDLEPPELKFEMTNSAPSILRLKLKLDGLLNAGGDANQERSSISRYTILVATITSPEASRVIYMGSGDPFLWQPQL